MSQLSNITKTFKAFSEKYNWSEKETVENMLSVLGDCEWALPINEVQESETIGFEEAMQINLHLEFEYVHSLLYPTQSK